MKSIVAILSLITAAGCADTTSPLSDRWFYLQTVNGASPPVVSESLNQKNEIISGDLFVNPDNTWSIDLLTHLTVGDATVTDLRSSGTWTRAKNKLELRDASNGSVLTASYSNDDNLITFGRNGLTFVYRRHPASGSIGF